MCANCDIDNIKTLDKLIEKTKGLEPPMGWSGYPGLQNVFLFYLTNKERVWHLINKLDTLPKTPEANELRKQLKKWHKEYVVRLQNALC